LKDRERVPRCFPLGIQGQRSILKQKREEEQEMASLLKERMMNALYFFPYFTWETPYRSEYVAELNIEKFKLMKDGTARFSHPQGTHDDTFWATALAVSAATETKTVDIQTIRFG